MLIVTLKVLLAFLSLAPIALAAMVFAARRAPSARLSELALIAMLTWPFVILAEMLGFSLLPGQRPLDLIPWAHAAIALACIIHLVVRRSSLAVIFARVRARIASARRQLSWPQRATIAVGFASLLAAAAVGSWLAPIESDGPTYHVPQAVQPWQDGRVGPVQSDYPYADSYPRACTLLWSWTMWFTHNDAAFDPMSATFGLTLMLAAYISARRLGADRAWAITLAAAILTTPIALLMCTVKFIDLPACALSAAAIAFALPRRCGRAESWSSLSLVGMLLAAALALSMKFIVIAVVGVVMLFRFVLAIIAPRPHTTSRTRDLLTLLIGCAAALAIASPWYIRTWIIYGTPVYPAQLRLGPWLIFDGPLGENIWRTQRTDTLLGRFAHYWLSFDGPQTIESPGGLGPLWGLLLMPCVGILVLSLVKRWNWSYALLAAALSIVLLAPSFHWPRYSIFIVAPGAAALASVATAITRREWREGLALSVLALSVTNATMWAKSAWGTIESLIASTDAPLFTQDRSRAAVDQAFRVDGRAPSPATRRALYAMIPDGRTAVYAIFELHALLYDPMYRYRVEYRPAQRRAIWESMTSDLQVGAAHAGEWLDGLKRDNVYAVLVYRGSAEDDVLAPTISGYELSYEQPPSEGGFPVKIYRRAAP